MEVMTNSAPRQEPPYGLRMPPDLKARVKAAAEANNRSMNAEIVAALEATYPAPPTMTADEVAALVDDLTRGFSDEQKLRLANSVRSLIGAGKTD